MKRFPTARPNPASPTKPGLKAIGTAAALVLAAMAIAAPQQAHAFCGFYVGGAGSQLFNNATQVVLMREGKRTVLSMENNYQGPPENFAMVVPVPVILEEDEVKTLPASIFADVDRMASPRLVEYWEQDPCNPYVYAEDISMVAPTSVEAGSVDYEEEDDDYGVTIEAQFEVGEYEVVILSAEESGGLNRWLTDNDYSIPDGAAPVLQPYIDQGLYFFVARVNIDKVTYKDGSATLSPLRFHYDSENFFLPVRLGLLNAKGAQDLIVHILARGQRYQVVNKPNVTIPTNVGVATDAKERFGEFYAALFDRTLQKNPGAVVTEYAWDASGCDPCPGPQLNAEHFVTLGADVLPNTDPWGFVLTRLHARYTKDQPSEDMIFAAAPPIVGGREVPGKNGEIEDGATPSGFNNFQGRYIIRHPWTGPITCDNPQRGIWGGPPGGHSSAPEPIASAQDTAFAPRGNIELARFVTKPVPELDISATELEEVKNTEPRPIDPSTVKNPGSGGCASCSTVDGGKSSLAWTLLGLMLGWVVLRRKKQR